MRNRYIHQIILVCGIVLSTASCKYQEIVDATYPDQKAYFPAAREGRFIVNNIAEPGKPYRYEADLTSGKFNIPLSVFRGAVNKSGSFTVNILADNDTINKLITDGTLLNTELLPPGQYTIPATLQVADGEERAQLSVSINMAYLIANADKQKAICLKVSGVNVSTNANLDKLIVIIDPVILKVTAAFQSAPSATNPKSIRFSNQSQNGLKYSWKFGDGSESKEKSPEHTYAAAGVYEVTLTAEGISGESQKSIHKETITIP